MTSTRKILDRNRDGRIFDDIGRGVVAAVVGVVVLVVVLAAWGSYARATTTTTVVTDKERVCKSGDNGQECEYLVFTEDGTYKVGDSLIAFRWNSSDVYGKIKRCHRYEIDHYGWRIPFGSKYPNITKATDLGKAEDCE